VNDEGSPARRQASEGHALLQGGEASPVALFACPLLVAHEGWISDDGVVLGDWFDEEEVAYSDARVSTRFGNESACRCGSGPMDLDTTHHRAVGTQFSQAPDCRDEERGLAGRRLKHDIVWRTHRPDSKVVGYI